MGSVFLIASELEVMVVSNGHVIFFWSQSNFFNLSLSVITYHAHVFMLPFTLIWNLPLFNTFKFIYSLAYTCKSHLSRIVVTVLPSNYNLTSLKLFSISVIHSVIRIDYISFWTIANFWTHVIALLMHNRNERWPEIGCGCGGEEMFIESHCISNCIPDSPT